MNVRLLFLIAAAIFISACKTPPSKYIYNEGFIYGTLYHIVYESPEGKDLQAEINEKLNEYNLIFSTYEESSDISKVNNNEKVKLDPLFIECFKRSMEISERTNGAFDITAGPLVNAWGFGPEDKKKMTTEVIDSLKKLTSYKKIRLKDGKISKENPNMKLDMSAVAKGFTSDLIADFLEKEQCKNYMIEIGGEVVALGKNEKGRVWTIGISKPDDNAFFAQNEIQAKVKLPENAMATSGNYRNFYVEDGKKYAHTIDPKTGYPVEHSLLSATVLADDCMTADAYATAFMVMGIEKSIDLAKELPELKVYFIYADADGENVIYMSEDFKQHLRE